MIENKRVIAIIPARAGSKLIKDKNIKLLVGKPLIYWSINVTKKSKYIDRVIVSTDGENIAQVARKYGAEVYVRPVELAQDMSLIIDGLRDIITKIKADGETANYLILIQPTSPLRTVEDIDNVIEKLLNYDSAATFCEAELNPYRAWKIEEENIIPFIDCANPWLPRQQLPKAYQLNGAVYGFNIDKLPSDGCSILFGNIASIIMPQERSIDIDNLIHFSIAEEIMKNVDYK